MALRQLSSVRKFSSSVALLRPKLSSDYTSRDIWEERFNCKLLTDAESIKNINVKITAKTELDELEVDTFINIAAPNTEEVAQLRETADILKRFRRSLRAHLLLPSTQHAVCRLFLESEKLSSLVNMIEQRVDYGIFPDPFSLNMSFETALDKDDLALASRLAVHIMLQEDFGQNHITDVFSLFSIGKYIESKPDFEKLANPDMKSDPIFTFNDSNQETAADSTKDSRMVDDEEEDEYVRIPFLRNPYDDNHFDIKNPRILCGKVFTMISRQFKSDKELDQKLKLIGSILQGRWKESSVIANQCVQSNLKAGQLGDVATFYVTNLHGVQEPAQEDKSALLSHLEKLSSDGKNISDHADEMTESFSEIESEDIKNLKSDMIRWSERRYVIKKAAVEWDQRQKLIADIKAKKDELKRKEEYLYFYDNLKKRTLGRLELD